MNSPAHGARARIRSHDACQRCEQQSRSDTNPPEAESVALVARKANEVETAADIQVFVRSIRERRAEHSLLDFPDVGGVIEEELAIVAREVAVGEGEYGLCAVRIVK